VFILNYKKKIIFYLNFIFNFISFRLSFVKQLSLVEEIKKNIKQLNQLKGVVRHPFFVACFLLYLCMILGDFMEPLSIISLFFNLATFNSNHEINSNNIQQQYHSVYQVKQEIFNGSFENSNLYNVKNISNLNISLNN
tara:strand:- start:128 stop:541 length:414 start_codon:yes stop_codon:yes gene_type:complete